MALCITSENSAVGSGQSLHPKALLCSGEDNFSLSNWLQGLSNARERGNSSSPRRGPKQKKKTFLVTSLSFSVNVPGPLFNLNTFGLSLNFWWCGVSVCTKVQVSTSSVCGRWGAHLPPMGSVWVSGQKNRCFVSQQLSQISSSPWNLKLIHQLRLALCLRWPRQSWHHSFSNYSLCCSLHKTLALQ